MENFNFCVGTRILFGKGQEEKLPELLRPYGNKVLLTYGGGSIKRTGLYDRIKNLLHEFEIFELGGIEPNPRIESVYAGAEICKEEDIDVILAVGGGSTIDCSKAIAAAAYYEGDAWDLILHPDWIEKALPICTVLTLSATGSEMDNGGVITNLKTKEKLGFGNPLLLPKASVLNPENTFTVPASQTAAGSADIMSHILEQYFSGEDDNTSDYIAEGLLRSLITSSKAAVKNPEDYEARSNIMWTATWALNTLIAMGKTTDWEVHMLGQAVGAHTDATHGMTLSAVSIPYYKYIMADGLQKFKRYAVNVWNVNPAGKTDEQIALEGLDCMESYMKEIGLVMNISEFGVTKDMIESVADSTLVMEGGYRVLTHEDIVNVLTASLS